MSILINIRHKYVVKQRNLELMDDVPFWILNCLTAILSEWVNLHISPLLFLETWTVRETKNYFQIRYHPKLVLHISTQSKIDSIKRAPIRHQRYLSNTKIKWAGDYRILKLLTEHRTFHLSACLFIQNVNGHHLICVETLLGDMKSQT